MECSNIIAIADIVVSAVFGIWIATAITKSQTKERFLKDYFINEISGIKEDCKIFFDDICYDKKSAKDIKIGLKLLSMRLSALETNILSSFKKVTCQLLQQFATIQMEITGCDDFNNQFQQSEVVFSAEEKSIIFENRHKLLTEFSKTVVTINKCAIKK